MTLPSIKEKFENKFWRLNNLYWIIDKRGKRVPFQMNWVQEKFFDELWYLNIVLKARQLGFSTFIDLYILDEAVFNPNVSAGIIAHNKDDASKIFRSKILYPYRNLPDQIKTAVYPTTDSKVELSLSNGSMIYVGTSMRSGTLQYLHVSELGKICRKYPEKAEEIKTGALNAVEAGETVFIESTAEGAVGDFHAMCRNAMARGNDNLSVMDYKFHFFPWFLNQEYNLVDENVDIDDELTTYFNNLEMSLSVTITPAQRAWYAKKAQQMGMKMKQEFPSTPDEAFEAGIQGLPFYRDNHVIAPRPVPVGAPLYFTYDWGYGAPYSMGWWWVDADNRVFRFSELYGDMYSKTRDEDHRDKGLRQTDSEQAEAVIAHEMELSKEFGISFDSIVRLCDPTCFNKKPDYMGGGQGPSTAEVFAAHGLYLSPGDATRTTKIRQFVDRLRLYDDQEPMLLVYSICHDFIRTVPAIQMDPKNPEYVDTTMPVHTFDDACHICMARPLSLQAQTKPKTQAEQRIDMVERLSMDAEEFALWQAEREIYADEMDYYDRI